MEMTSKRLSKITTNRDKTILIVEDDADFALFLADAITQETSYQPVVAQSASQAFRLTQNIKPDLLILDYHLPSMNGLELYDWLCTDPIFEDVPALLLTASQGMPTPEVKRRSIIGLGKPIELDNFLDIVKNLLANGENKKH